jgi:hypothetical protein
VTTLTLKFGRTVAEDDGFSVSCAIAAPDMPSELWFRVQTTAAERQPPDDLGWALVAMLMPAMRAGLDLHIDGPVSARLVFNANHDVQAALRVFDHRLQRITITAAELTTTGRAERSRLGTGFSAGIDSFATVSMLLPQAGGEGLALTDLCVFNVGAFGPSDDPHVRQRYAAAYARALAFARQIGASVTGVESNLDAFFGRAWSFQRTHSLRNVSAALVMAGSLDDYLYASTFPLTAIRVTEHYDLAIMDPILLPLLSTEKLAFRSAGAGLSRFEKTALVAQNALSYDQLDVCVAPAQVRAALDRPNCSRCWKCNRTMLTLDLLGALDNYARVFDLTYYREHRDRIVQAVAVKAYRGSEVDQEVIDKFLELRLPSQQRPFFLAKVRGQIGLQTLQSALKNAKKRFRLFKKAARARSRE